MKTLYLQYDDGVGGTKDNTFLSFEWVAESENKITGFLCSISDSNLFQITLRSNFVLDHPLI